MSSVTEDSSFAEEAPLSTDLPGTLNSAGPSDGEPAAAEQKTDQQANEADAPATPQGDLPAPASNSGAQTEAPKPAQ